MVLILKFTTSHFDGEELYDKNGKMINILKILGTIIAIICFCSSVYRMAEDGKLCLFASDKEKKYNILWIWFCGYYWNNILVRFAQVLSFDFFVCVFVNYGVVFGKFL